MSDCETGGDAIKTPSTSAKDTHKEAHEAPSVASDLFKTLMRSIASSVAVITTCHEGQGHGMTATAVCSVSADPPSLLIVVNRTARSHSLISASRAFVVNVLADHQTALSERFAGKCLDQFDGVSTRPGFSGCPVIDGVAAHIECVVADNYESGTHTIFIGRVVGGGVTQARPIIYHDGGYKSFPAA